MMFGLPFDAAPGLRQRGMDSTDPAMGRGFVPPNPMGPMKPMIGGNMDPSGGRGFVPPIPGEQMSSISGAGVPMDGGGMAGGNMPPPPIPSRPMNDVAMSGGNMRPPVPPTLPPQNSNPGMMDRMRGAMSRVNDMTQPRPQQQGPMAGFQQLGNRMQRRRTAGAGKLGFGRIPPKPKMPGTF